MALAIKPVSKDFAREKTTITRIFKMLLWIPLVFFFYLSIPAYILYQSLKPANPEVFRHQLWKNIPITALYTIPYTIFLLMLGLGQEGPAKGFGNFDEFCGIILVVYAAIHLVLLFVGTKTKNIKLLKILLWLPAVVFGLVLLLSLL